MESNQQVLVKGTLQIVACLSPLYGVTAPADQRVLAALCRRTPADHLLYLSTALRLEVMEELKISRQSLHTSIKRLESLQILLGGKGSYLLPDWCPTAGQELSLSFTFVPTH